MRSIVILLLVGSWANAAEVLATRLDGQSIKGGLESWDQKRAVIETSEGQTSLPTDELLSLRWLPAPPPEATAVQHAGQVELIDGTLLPIEAIECRGAKAIVTPQRPTPSPNKEVLPRKLVAAVRLQPLETEAVAQWEEVRAMEAAADVLVVIKRDGKSLDYVECLLGDVTEDKIEFELDGESQRVDRKQIAGFIIYHRDTGSQTEPRLLLKGRGGLAANATGATLADGVIHVSTAAGAEIEWPLDDIYLADFSAGKILYLSDMEPASQQWTPLIGLPPGAEVAARYGEPRRDQSAYSGSLSLLSRDGSSGSSSAAPQLFTKGLAIRSRTELVYRMPRGFRRLKAVAGIDPAARASGNLQLEVFGDDRRLLTADVAGTDAPRDIDLDVSGVKRLKLVVDYGTNLDTGDWLNLCDARLLK